MKNLLACLVVCLGLPFANSAHAVTNLLTNPGFLDTDGDPNDPSPVGDDWGAFGNAGFNDFFGSTNPHASLFGGDALNSGGFFQQGISGTPGVTYQFDLIGTRIESSWDADLQFGVEFYAADDATKLGETKVMIDTATRIANGTIDGNVFSMQATAPVGTAFARPIAQFDNVNFGYVGQSQANVFPFNSYLSEVPAPSGELLKNSGFEDEDGQGDPGDYWGSFGNAGFHDFFSGGAGGAHASLFSDSLGNSGGIYQQSVLGSEGASYEFALLDVRIEENFDADMSFGLEFFADDDFTKVGDTIIPIDSNTGQVEGNTFVMSGVAPAGTTYVRPVVLFGGVIDADFDDDNLVDGRDFLTWQRGSGTGTAHSEGDANNNGNVDGEDLAIWESQYGTTNASQQRNVFIFDASLVELPLLLGALKAVPEPSGFALTLFAVVTLCGRSRR